MNDVFYCADCRHPIDPNTDDALVCTYCGGRSLRLTKHDPEITFFGIGFCLGALFGMFVWAIV